VNGSTWSRLGTIYRQERRLGDAINAWKRAGELLRRPDAELLSLGYAELDAHKPREALRAFDRARSTRLEFGSPDANFLANVAAGRARAWSELGDLKRAIAFAEESVRLAPDRAAGWLQLANLYSRDQRAGDADRAREHVPAVEAGEQPPESPHPAAPEAEGGSGR
jgi:tetratricopeptide (TPR) repeat protein